MKSSEGGTGSQTYTGLEESCCHAWRYRGGWGKKKSRKRRRSSPPPPLGLLSVTSSSFALCGLRSDAHAMCPSEACAVAPAGGETTGVQIERGLLDKEPSVLHTSEKDL